jgi:hypothetical protein
MMAGLPTASRRNCAGVRADGRDRLGVVGRGGFWGALLGNKTCLWWCAPTAQGVITPGDCLQPRSVHDPAAA